MQIGIMPARRIALAAIGLLASVLTIIPTARADDELPTIRILPCVTVCAKAMKAVPIDKPKPRFPMAAEEAVANYVEGLVDIRYTIGTDGHVRDAVVSQLIGPKEFAAVAIDTVKTWLFKPAEADGVPAEQVSTIRFDFRMRVPDVGARPEIARKFNIAKSLISDNRLDEALAVLTEAPMKPRLNYYERTMIAYLTALLYAQRKDYLTAQDYIALATIHDGGDLNHNLRKPAIELHIRLNLMVGEIVDALNWLDRLKRLGDLADDDPIIKTVADVRAKFDTLDAIPVLGKIPPPDNQNGWGHMLYRRTYSFANVVGKLERLQLSCDQQSIESAITETAQWHVPKNWSNCAIYVYGTPGTTFALIEAN